MKMKMSNRDKKILLFFGAILIVAASYFLVFTKMMEKKNTLVDANASLRTEVQQLETMEAQKASVQEETQKYQQNIAKTLSKFPSEVRTQNAIYDLNEMYEGIENVKIQSESYKMNQIFYQPGAATAADGTNTNAAPAASTIPASTATVSAITSDTSVKDIVSAAANYIGYRSDVAVAFTAPYNSLKEVVNYINNSEDRMTITDISATKDAESDDLTCSMTISMYAISGTGEIYQQPNVDDPGSKKQNIFK